MLVQVFAGAAAIWIIRLAQPKPRQIRHRPKEVFRSWLQNALKGWWKFLRLPSVANRLNLSTSEQKIQQPNYLINNFA
jgi:hypothetical protein